MSSVHLTFIAVTALVAVCSSQSYQDMFCAEFKEIINTNMCPHGARNNSCNKLACLKGLGDSCDVMDNPTQFGDCADGLFCACGHCIGCIRGKCRQNNCLQHWKGLDADSYKVPAQQLETNRYRKRMMKMPFRRYGYDYSNSDE